MRPTTRQHSPVRAVAVALISALIAPLAQSAPTDLASEPLNNPAASTKPNLQFILDDSGSMGWDFSPDYMSDDSTGNEEDFRVCFDHRDASSTDVIEGTGPGTTAAGADLKECWMGDPPFAAYATNKQYYNPSIRYNPPVVWDDPNKAFSTFPSQTAAATASWTVVPTDPFGVQRRSQLNGYGAGTVTTTVNLVTGYPDRLWCANTSDANAACRRNAGAYEYPSHEFGKGKTATTTNKGDIRYTFGAPYYYDLIPTEFCSTPDLVTCNAQLAPDGAFPFPAPVRWCTNAGFTDCQGKRTGSYTYPKFVGTVASSPGAPAAGAAGTLVVGNSGSTPTNVNSILVDGVNILAPATLVSSPGGGTDSSTERRDFAQDIRAAIVANSGTSGYTACDGSQFGCNLPNGSNAPDGTVVIRTVATGPAANGFGIAATSLTTAGVPATADFRVIRSSNSGTGSVLATLTANGVDLIGGSVTCDTNNESTCANIIEARINANSGSNGGYTASSPGTTVTVTAPPGLGAAANGFVLAGSGSVSTNLNRTFSGGDNSPAINYTSTPMTGGTDGVVAFDPTRENVGAFSRVNIVPLNPDLSPRTFPRGTARTDCISFNDRCTYSEEMTNFANWYSYYRTRMQMMKSATGRAFLPLTSAYRVGFITINFATSKYLKISDYETNNTTGGHKKFWYDKLYAASPSGSTPLRDALSRAGWIFAGKLNTGLTAGIPVADDPVQFACQPNFSILSSDGYWNSTGGSRLNGTSMGNEDGTNGSYSSRTAGAYEGPSTTSDTLSDVALHYYKTDLRPTLDDLVTPSSKEVASMADGIIPSHQRMLTFTMGLGLDGFLSYERDYDDLAKTTGDFYALRIGTKNWPVPVTGTTEDPGKLDDLWHAAVNGRGKFFSASNPQDIESGLSDALTALQVYTGSGAAAATSTQQPVDKDNFAFIAQYTSVEWTGDVRARTIDLNTGNISATDLWSAAEQLESKPWETRSIFLFDGGDTAGNQLRNFCWPGSLDASCADGAGLTAAEQAYFNPNLLGQYASWTAAQRTAATGESLVNFLRGDRSRETTGGTDTSDLYRERAGVLGDIVSAKPAYVRDAAIEYGDAAANPGFREFSLCLAGKGPANSVSCPVAQFPTPLQARRPTLFVAANDGLLHAIETDLNNDAYTQTGGINTTDLSDDTFSGNNAGNGGERWAYLPSMVLPGLHQLAETPYAHTYFTDGSPASADICLSAPCAGLNDWRTILVAGLNSGGRGYYALDITDADNPKGLWELTSSTTCLSDAQANPASIAAAAFADCHLGYSHGNPLITKRKSDNRWVVIVASGYNNFNPGNGGGYLYILDAGTGAILNRIATGEGSGGTAGAGFSDANPSGLAKINGWVDSVLANNVTLAVYGGDLFGNMWRFNLDPSQAGYLKAVKLFTATTSLGAAQPITTFPELGEVQSYRAIFFGTGLYLGTGDKADTQPQSIYGIRDDQSVPLIAGNAVVPGRASLVEQQFTSGASGNLRTVAKDAGGNPLTVNWSSNPGWFIDLPDTGERVNVDPFLQLGTLVVASNVPGNEACTAGGFGWVNFLNFKTGGDVSGYTYASKKNPSSVIVGLSYVNIDGRARVIVQGAKGDPVPDELPVEALVFSGRRVGWRELTVDR